ncbi:Aldo/keto reductase family protein [Amycolatopsis pretoriensis]|uniref:Aldo/keto reductase family protein n=1 Tax=Amycolatopsis pretoriensis TaxID=218821 RepID=A0A1H5RIA8_9PSEU|nr:aldo/keto reductase [Amycolatopsis pretoriensis]SEF38103.1 Aldo/keto reductase family protein [Amycolatopsis pretoriensis]
MRYQLFGRSGLRISEYVLGAATFGSEPAVAGVAGAKAIFEGFVAAGGTTFDVSNIYRNGEAESILGDLLGRDREDFVLITKYSGTRLADVRPGTTGSSRRTMVRSLEDSLRRLKPATFTSSRHTSRMGSP